MLSKTEENYLKSILHLTELSARKGVGTNELAADLNVKPATVSDMLKKLKEKKLVDYKKYGKISLTAGGKKLGMEVIRKHRLWETFLYEKLNFSWDEVHDVAEQLEHIKSKKLVDGLDVLLDYPEFDPHGDAIPDADGNIRTITSQLLCEIEEGTTCEVIGVKDTSTAFLQFADKIGLKIGGKLKIVHKEEFDASLTVRLGKKEQIVSEKFAENVFVQTKK